MIYKDKKGYKYDIIKSKNIIFIDKIPVGEIVKSEDGYKVMLHTLDGKVINLFAKSNYSVYYNIIENLAKIFDTHKKHITKFKHNI